jgi:PII-like signaling protein
MKGTNLRIYVTEREKHSGELLYEWILEQARGLGIRGGSAFRAIAGYGRHGMKEEGFFELAGDVPVVVEFIATEVQAERLLAMLKAEKLSLVYVKTTATLGTT